MALMTWKDAYSVKVQSIDDQHKQLFDLINQLHDAMKTGKAREFLSEVLDRLIDYTKTHFTNEEYMLAKVNYAEYLPHMAEHRKFTDKIEAISRELKAGSTGLSIELMQFLQDWLVNHIMKVDQKYSPMLSKV